ncbi:hypothetical protein PHMEG_00025796 [Phytophthora megakarya]|uniref:Uncharacterized protein n=1 Tax=Phytophthora megakarya TaxID=4795 RepID=A0A225VB70_9STRA|nr:hypothetical protein PHMEG_00025796 [Phytophthora megakarya]
MPDIRDESHAIHLFNMGYETLRLKPSKRYVEHTKLNLQLCCGLSVKPIVNALDRCRSNIASGRSHHQATPFLKSRELLSPLPTSVSKTLLQHLSKPRDRRYRNLLFIYQRFGSCNSDHKYIDHNRMVHE